MKDNLLDLFNKCLNAKYLTVGDDVNYCFMRNGNSLEIYFEKSSGSHDWINNFKFKRTPYKEMGKPFKVHGGFLSCWKQAEDLVLEQISDKSIKEIIITGYSHGAALALLCHEFCWFHRKDIRGKIRGYGYGCPRVYGGWFIKKDIKVRWENFTVIRKREDIVTHLPFFIMRFRHVGNMIKLGSRKDDSPIDSHRPDRYIRELNKYINETEALKR